MKEQELTVDLNRLYVLRIHLLLFSVLLYLLHRLSIANPTNILNPSLTLKINIVFSTAITRSQYRCGLWMAIFLKFRPLESSLPFPFELRGRRFWLSVWAFPSRRFVQLNQIPVNGLVTLSLILSHHYSQQVTKRE